MENNKINIAKILKDCPQGMELNCIIYEDCEFLNVDTSNDRHSIRIKTPDGQISLNEYGCYHNTDKAKCVIFPKGKTTWEGFVPPCKFKDGDILSSRYGNPFILKAHLPKCDSVSSYCALDFDDNFQEGCDRWTQASGCRLATEEEKQKLFDAIQENGYKWNPDTKTLEKLVELKFKVGDKVKRKNVNYTHIVTITEIDGDYYGCVNEDKQYSNIYVKTAQDNWESVSNKIEPKFKVGDTITDGEDSFTIDYMNDECYYNIKVNTVARLFIKYQDVWELVPNKFDISTLKPFDKVLVRHNTNEKWDIDFFSCIDNGKMFRTITGTYVQCIPYEGNKHLLDTDKDCNDYYKTWEE